MLLFDSQLLVGIALQLINTCILAFALSKILYSPVKKFLHERKSRISQNLDDAREALKNAEEAKLLYDEKFAGIDAERKEILMAARARAAEIEERMINEAKLEAENIKDRAQREMAMERENSLEELRRQIIEISTIIAERYVEEKMDERTGKKLLDEAINDLGDSAWLN